jgi:hypothetical protein
LACGSYTRRSPAENRQRETRLTGSPAAPARLTIDRPRSHAGAKDGESRKPPKRLKIPAGIDPNQRGFWRSHRAGGQWVVRVRAVGSAGERASIDVVVVLR